MTDTVNLLGRILLSAIFIAAGVQKIVGYDGPLAFMAQYGVPGFMLPGVIALELLGGVAVLVGFGARWVALALAVFTVIAAMVFHSNFTEPIQVAMFMKNLAIAGGLLLLFAHGPGRYAVRD